MLILAMTASLLFYSCEVKIKAGETEKIRNGIELNAKGLQVKQAFLLHSDGTLIPDDNKVNVGEDVKLRLIISGWKEYNGFVFPGAAEKIAASDGAVLLDEPDLFVNYDNIGVSAKDAEYITLTATITKVDKLYDYFLVSFRVWDKKGAGEITGSYKLHL